MDTAKLESIARTLVNKGKGILAADESSGTIKKRFDSIRVESTEKNRLFYRHMLFTTKGISDFISGVILFDETIHQTNHDGVPLHELLIRQGILPGIKVDKGAKEMAGFPGEKITEGLDGLRDRLLNYRDLGARFAKWRSVITIAGDIPTSQCINSNARGLAIYAALCQEVGLVPIVEPEVLMDGTHDLERCEQITAETLVSVFSELHHHRVHLEGILLKPNMVVSGKTCAKQAPTSEVAQATIRCFKRVIPSSVPGIVFLSGGQTPKQATENLNAINAIGTSPWQLSFSYGRALQEAPLKTWGGQESNFTKAQEIFYHRSKCTAAARDGHYRPVMEDQ